MEVAAMVAAAGNCQHRRLVAAVVDSGSRQWTAELACGGNNREFKVLNINIFKAPTFEILYTLFTETKQQVPISTIPNVYRKEFWYAGKDKCLSLRRDLHHYCCFLTIDSIEGLMIMQQHQITFKLVISQLKAMYGALG
ncbi:hypothetical protein IEQ34_013691 [Dendrobium chrysotoxum]|uniref:Uncharacterized protein n=1 Tax=Dendrobium chrysotoxum TaxID=161865 RepID=A0AAV7GQD8_DENCH|nr:hypothetical protein IEQ34_013691 [Dendrobium chrysotoxum]